MAQITSVYADVWRALTRINSEAAWPAAPKPNVKPVKTAMGGWGREGEPVEGVLVITGMVGAAESQEAKTTNFGRDEVFTTELGMQTAIPGRTPEQALDRLEQLTIVEEQLILLGTRAAFQPVEVKSRAWWWGIVGMEGGVWPTDKGWVGGTRFTIAVRARIGGS